MEFRLVCDQARVAEIRALESKGKVFKRLAKLQGTGTTLECSLPNDPDASAKMLMHLIPGASVSVEATIEQGYQGRMDYVLQKVTPIARAQVKAA